MKVFYFGCHNNQSGHYLFSSEWRNTEYIEGINFPFRWQNLDGGFAPRKLQYLYPGEKEIIFAKDFPQKDYWHLHSRSEELPNGIAALHRINGWTVLSFWDNSVDRRGASNSSFVFDNDTIDFTQAVEEAKRAFPSVWNRYKFQVTELKNQGSMIEDS